MTCSDVLTCLHGQHVVFIGDVKMKQFFTFLASLLTDEPHIVKDNLVGLHDYTASVVIWLLL